MPTTKIDEYEVMYSANLFGPRIWLKANGMGVGQLNFHKNGATLPQDSTLGGVPNLHYHLDNFQHCIDLLRNEKPIYLFYNGSGGGNENGIRTTPEKVGEGE